MLLLIEPIVLPLGFCASIVSHLVAQRWGGEIKGVWCNISICIGVLRLGRGGIKHISYCLHIIIALLQLPYVYEMERNISKDNSLSGEGGELLDENDTHKAPLGYADLIILLIILLFFILNPDKDKEN